MEKFLLLKKNITNYFKCTKQFKEQFVAGIEKLDISLVKRYSEEKNETKAPEEAKKKKKNSKK